MAQRRTKGEGGLTQRHDARSCPPPIDGTRPEHRCRGRWQATLDVIIDGRRKRRTIYGRTKADAQVKLIFRKRQRMMELKARDCCGTTNNCHHLNDCPEFGEAARAAMPCEITIDGWCANHSTGEGPVYCGDARPRARA